MNPTEIEFAVRDLVAKPHDPATFPFDLIGIFNTSKVTVSRLKSGQTNAAKQPGDVLWRKHLFFRQAGPDDDVGAIGDALAADPLTAKHKPRFIFVTNGDQVHARDLQLDDTLNIEYGQLDESSDFLLPLAGYERRATVEEHPADIKAAKKLKKLYDAVLAANPTWSAGHHTHELNLLMTRLLFCFYAEDTGIFETPQLFTKTLTQHTSEGGNDVAPLLDRLFRIMNIKSAERPRNTPTAEAKFPYVNGSLFEDTVEIPAFTRTARRQMLECGDLDWTTINPDIFGSMIQTISQDATRSDLGMHYTSVPNIMKVLQPLLLDELHDAYEKAKDSIPKLEALLGRLSNIRVFDPACGSGNFLIIAYKEMRKLEIQALKRISEIAPKTPLKMSGISLDHFYGIDVVDFACETAKLSLWIADHQMHSAFKEILGETSPSLPLAKITTVKCGNATRMDWLAVCPPQNGRETFVCGNPPYLGAKHQSPSQRSDVVSIFGSILDGDTNIDYVGCWFVKLADYIAAVPSTSGALVSTNSICQGEQVAFLWPYIFSHGVRIIFAHRSFKWANSAQNNAGVTCAIVGLGIPSSRERRLFTDSYVITPPSITAYLAPGPEDLVVHATSRALNGFPAIAAGSQPKDGGNLMLTPEEKNRLIEASPEAAVLIRPFYSAEDLLYGVERYTLWIPDTLLTLANSIPFIVDRLEKTRKDREKGGQDKKRVASTPHRYARNAHKEREAIVIPGASSERRPYLPVDIVGPSDIVANTLHVVYSPEPYVFAVLSSRMHRLWAEAVAGRLKTDIRYSANLVYNTFPIPDLSLEQKRVLGDYSRAIIKARAKHPGKALASLYNPESMPDDIKAIHKQNDAYIEEQVYGRNFKDDTHRLEHLFAMYARLRERQRTEGSLLETQELASA
ncbi:MAG TPA: DNA methyltransferase [Candidatus Cybelea sp.]|nr:DNA methyltransferase [Candidatus Cybelea sp.]